MADLLILLSLSILIARYLRFCGSIIPEIWLGFWVNWDTGKIMVPAYTSAIALCYRAHTSILALSLLGFLSLTTNSTYLIYSAANWICFSLFHFELLLLNRCGTGVFIYFYPWWEVSLRWTRVWDDVTVVLHLVYDYMQILWNLRVPVPLTSLLLAVVLIPSVLSEICLWSLIRSWSKGTHIHHITQLSSCQLRN